MYARLSVVFANRTLQHYGGGGKVLEILHAAFRSPKTYRPSPAVLHRGRHSWVPLRYGVPERAW
jgi:hypothetical protein